VCVCVCVCVFVFNMPPPTTHTPKPKEPSSAKVHHAICTPPPILPLPLAHCARKHCHAEIAMRMKLAIISAALLPVTPPAPTAAMAANALSGTPAATGGTPMCLYTGPGRERVR
jgi:hypothetical protein